MRLAFALLLLNGSLMAGIYACAKIAAAHGVAPLSVLAWQLPFAAVVVCTVAAARGELRTVRPDHVRYAAIAGAIGISLPSLVTFSALERVPAGTIGVIGGLSPVFTYAIALAVRVERFDRMRALGVLLGFAGVLAIVAPRGELPDPAALPWALAAVAAPLLLGAGNVYRSAAWPAGLAPLGAAGLMLAIQSIAVVPLAAALDRFVVPGATVPGAGAVPTAAAAESLLAAGAFMAVFYLGAFELQRRGGAVLTGQLGSVITCASLVLGTALFGERPSAWTAVALVLVFAGVGLVSGLRISSWRSRAIPASAR